MSKRKSKISFVAIAAILLVLVSISFVAWMALSGSATQIGKIRAAAAAGSLFLLFATFESIRKTHLKEGYALLWVLPAGLVLLLASFPSALDAIRDRFGMEYGTTMAAVVFACLLLAVFVICRTLSKNERNIAKIAQQTALLEARIRELEAASAKKSKEGASGRG